MANIKEMARNALLVGGLLTTTGAVVDGMNGGFKGAFEEAHKRTELSESLQDKYGVEYACSIFFGSGTGECYEVVPGDKTSEEADKIFHEYHEELKEEQGKIPVDARGNMDMLGGTVGALATVAGVLVKKLNAKK